MEISFNVGSAFSAVSKSFMDSCNDFFALQSDKELLSLPIGEHLEDDEIENVVNILNRY